MKSIIRTILKSNLLVIMLMLGFMACDKQGIVEEDLNGFDVGDDRSSAIAAIQAEHKIMMDRIRSSNDPALELRKINEEHGRFVDEKGDAYLNEEDYKAIKRSRENPNARATIIYNSWYNPSTDGVGTVYYWDGGAYQYFAALQSGEAFLTCPSNWTLCNGYNQYLMLFSCIYQNGCTGCRDLYGRFWQGSTLRDNDRFSYNVGYNGDWFEARIRDSIYSGPCCFSTRQYVINGAGCGYGFGGCQQGNCPGPVCGFYE